MNSRKYSPTPVLAERVNRISLDDLGPRRGVCLSYYGPIILQLIERRKELRLSQADLEDLMGCAEGHIAKFESGAKFPSTYSLAKWARALQFRFEIVADDQAS